MRPTSSRMVMFVLLTTLGLVGSLAGPATAADWTVEPAANSFGADRQEYRHTLNPGGRLEDGMVIVNPDEAPLRLALRAESEWVHLDRDDVTVGPGESVEVPFVVTLPKDAAPGDYVGGIVTSPGQADEASLQIRLRVGGTLTPSLAVENLHVDYSDTPNPIGKGEATVTYTIHNTGNAILTAHQAVAVSGPFGRWSVAAGKIADTPPLLPGETWKVSAPLHGVAPALRLTATVTLVPVLTDAAGSTAPLAATKASGHAWTVPWYLLVTIVVLCGLVVSGLAFRPRRRRARVMAIVP